METLVLENSYKIVMAIFVAAYMLHQIQAQQFGPHREKTCLREFANNTGAHQPAHPRSLISAFVISVLESTISRLATHEISVF